MISKKPRKIDKLIYKTSNVPATTQISELRKLYNQGLLAQFDEFEKNKIPIAIVCEKKLTTVIKNLLIELKTTPQLPKEYQEKLKKLKVLKENRQVYRESILEHKKHTYASLDAISNRIIAQTTTHKKVEQILGTLMLNYSTTSNELRVRTNSESKSIYISVLAINLVKDLIEQEYKFKNIYINQTLKLIETEELPKQQTLEERIYSPIVQGVYIQQLGLKSVNSQQMLEDNKYKLDPKQREEYLTESMKSSLEFLLYGLSPVAPRINSKEEETIWKQESDKKVAFIRNTFNTADGKSGELKEILKVCQIYTSLILPDSHKQIENSHIKAYEALKTLSEKSKVNPHFAKKLMQMTGKFPPGTGLFIYEEGSIERAIVTRLYPDTPEEPTAKTISRGGIFNKSLPETIIEKKQNLFYNYRNIPEYLRKPFEMQYSEESKKKIWKPNDLFGRTISGNTLWK
jgi:hypothetical protein